MVGRGVFHSTLTAKQFTGDPMGCKPVELHVAGKAASFRRTRAQTVRLALPFDFIEEYSLSSLSSLSKHHPVSQ